MLLLHLKGESAKVQGSEKVQANDSCILKSHSAGEAEAGVCVKNESFRSKSFFFIFFLERAWINSPQLNRFLLTLHLQIRLYLSLLN